MPDVVVVGVTHQSAPVAIRERLMPPSDGLAAALQDVVADGDVAEALLLTTCNRVELYAIGSAPAVQAAFVRLGDRAGVPAGTLRAVMAVRRGGEAVRHLFRVATGLESVVVGESQIVGQLREALAAARAAGTVGDALGRVVDQALAVAKRARTETGLGQHAVSVPFAAVELGRKIFGDLRGVSALLVGAGAMGELTARHLVAHGIARLIVTNRTPERAATLAAALGAATADFARLGEALADVDIVVAAAGAERPFLTRAVVAAANGRRRGRPLFLVDIAVPRAVARDVAGLANVFSFDVDDLGHVVDANRRERLRAAARAATMIDRDATTFVRRQPRDAATPTIVALRAHVEAMRRAEVERALRRLGGESPDAREALEAFSQALVNKILHTPTVRLREAFDAGAAPTWRRTVAELFGLDDRTSSSRRPNAVVAPTVAS
ncbi:MAG: glutamyl-tRNA reductase [Candidatus Rokubacteria bacterium]|nr:glutamyl-tRNA reductase [Candidatus Rokubacteria bacterium]